MPAFSFDRADFEQDFEDEDTWEAAIERALNGYVDPSIVEAVGEGSDPLTAEQMRLLDEACADWGVVFAEPRKPH